LSEGPLAGNSRQIDLDRLPADISLCQCFAVYTNDRFRGAKAIEKSEETFARFKHNMGAYPDRIRQVLTPADIDEAFAAKRTAAMLTVENLSILAGDVDRVDLLAERGVRIASLTWNGDNELGGGVGGDPERGLADFGREAISRMEALGIVADVSHTNLKTFWDMASAAGKPFIATHSNCLSICGHKRNLSDDQIREIGKSGGLIGLNFEQSFIRDDGNVRDWSDLLRHVERIAELAGDRIPALGSDFDGSHTPPFLQSPADLRGLYEAVCQSNLGEDFARRLFFDNAYDFFTAYK
jgi:membrane dipeptidase